MVGRPLYAIGIASVMYGVVYVTMVVHAWSTLGDHALELLGDGLGLIAIGFIGPITKMLGHVLTGHQEARQLRRPSLVPHRCLHSHFSAAERCTICIMNGRPLVESSAGHKFVAR
eukprot:COSAG04_NODE_2723_length_3679_cov_5.069274_4_plen_115_part_00